MSPGHKEVKVGKFENDLVKKGEVLVVALEAIETVRLGFPENGNASRLLRAVYRLITEKVCAMPPEVPEVIRCRDCKWWKKEDKSLQGRCALLQMYPTPAWFCGNAQKKDGEK